MDKLVLEGGGINTETLAGRVRDYLRTEIMEDRIPMGQRLREADLAAMFGISRAPVRDALRELAAEGWVTIVPRHGAVVTTVSREEFLEAYQIREALEGLAVRLAVPRLTAEDLATLRELNQEMKQLIEKKDIEAYFKVNLQFHRVFVERSGNGRLVELYDQLMAQIHRIRPASVLLRGGMESSTAEHEALLAAVEQGEPDKAAALMMRHIREPQRALEEMIRLEAEGKKDEPN